MTHLSWLESAAPNQLSDNLIHWLTITPQPMVSAQIVLAILHSRRYHIWSVSSLVHLWRQLNYIKSDRRGEMLLSTISRPTRRCLVSTIIFGAPPGYLGYLYRASGGSLGAAREQTVDGRRTSMGYLGPLQFISAPLPVLPRALQLHPLEPPPSRSPFAHFSTPPLKPVSLNGTNKRPNFKETCILVDAPVMYEAVWRFIDALKTEPTSILFSRYLVLRGDI